MSPSAPYPESGRACGPLRPARPSVPSLLCLGYPQPVAFPLDHLLEARAQPLGVFQEPGDELPYLRVINRNRAENAGDPVYLCDRLNAGFREDLSSWHRGE
jgi:hypothetical protein